MCKINFNESCPVCGRKLMVPIEFLGLEVQCSHCKGFFRARDEGARSRRVWEMRSTLNERADELVLRYRGSRTDR